MSDICWQNVGADVDLIFPGVLTPRPPPSLPRRDGTLPSRQGALWCQMPGQGRMLISSPTTSAARMQRCVPVTEHAVTFYTLAGRSRRALLSKCRQWDLAVMAVRPDLTISAAVSKTPHPRDGNAGAQWLGWAVVPDRRRDQRGARGDWSATACTLRRRRRILLCHECRSDAISRRPLSSTRLLASTSQSPQLSGQREGGVALHPRRSFSAHLQLFLVDLTTVPRAEDRFEPAPSASQRQAALTP
jgi:hypothetical protein